MMKDKAINKIHQHGESCGCGHSHEHHEHHHHEHHHHEHHDHAHECHDGCAHVCESHEELAQTEFWQGMEKKVYILENLGCANCAAKMERQINALPEVEKAILTYATKQLVVASDHSENMLPKLQEICSSIEEEVVVVPREEAERQKKEKKSVFEENKKDIFSVIAGAVLFAAGIFTEDIVFDFPVSAVLFVTAYVVLGLRILWTAVKNLRKGKVLDENFLMSVATLAAFVIGDFAEAVGVMLFYRVGELFEEIAVSRSRSQIMDAVDLRPEVVNLFEDGEVKVIPAQEAKVSDILLIRPGDRVPLDGKIVEGQSRVDTSAVTGEPVPVNVYPDTEVLSGCVNEQGMLKMEVQKPLSESMVTRILDSVENAAASKPKIDRFITRFAGVYTPIVVVLALATAIIPSLITGDWNHWIYTAITFLVISCPCALVLSVPLAFFSGIGSGSRKGILFKGGVAIEALKDVKAVVMDKTGTLTKGNFVVRKVVTLGKLTEKQLLTIAADCELVSTHPIGTSIVDLAREKELTLMRPKEVEEISGKGIRAVFSEGVVLCGSRGLMNLYGVDVCGYQNSDYGSEVLVAVDGVLEGYMVVSDVIKPEAKESITRMKKAGLMTAMLTGDEKNSAKKVAQAIGIDEVHAGLLPQDKLTHLQDIRKRYGAVMFVGDGINDAPVLAGADVGAAMGSGADAAIEAADVVFMTSSVDAISESVKIARTTGRIAMQNVVFALAVKFLVMFLGFFGYANMWMAVFADTGVAMLCVLNAIRMLWLNSCKK